MCGIYGILGECNKTILKKMGEVLKHRGPDDEGIYLSTDTNPDCKTRVGLGHRRLSIIDLSDNGHQPMPNEDGTIWIILNGEIYNYLELRQHLIKKHIFRSNTDTEVILHLYEDEGIDCLKHLNGMYAFALWDSKEEILLLARDRLGEKPLFYTQLSNRLLFASEIKALLQHPDVKREVHLESLFYYLSFLFVPGPYTIFKDIQQLPPGCFMICKNGNQVIQQYWDVHSFDASEEPTAENRESDYAEKIYHLLRESVKLRLRSDVPLGAFLSGGVDSSFVVGLMAELTDKPVETFTIGFDQEGSTFNEFNYAKKVAQHFCTNHHELVVQSFDLAELLPKLIWHFDQPFAGAIHKYLISKLVKEHVTVALSGLGGDELFGGYTRNLIAKLTQIYNDLPKIIKTGIFIPTVRTGIHLLPHNRYTTVGNHFVQRANMSVAGQIADLLSCTTDKFKSGIFSKEFKERLSTMSTPDFVEQHLGRPKDADVFEALLYVQIKLKLADEFLAYTDRYTMAHALEARVPLLDHNLVEFAARMPRHLKVKGFQRKYILKKIASNLLPKEVISRKKKGFSMPIQNWLKGSLKDLVLRTLIQHPKASHGYFDVNKIKLIVDSYYSQSETVSHNLIWALVQFQIWHKMYIENSITAEPPDSVFDMF